MAVLRGVSLMAAVASMGFVASVFVFYSSTIMPGLGSAGDRTFVGAFQAIDKAIINPLFLGFGFLGALLLTALAGVLHLLGSGRRAAVLWIAAALVLYLVAVIITYAVHLPLNDALKAAGDPDRIADLAAVRDQFKESSWIAWNHARSILGVAAFGCLAWALVLFGRTLPPT